MKLRPSHYARAFLDAIAGGVSYETAKERLLALLAKKGDAHRLSQVVHEVEKIEVAKQGGHMVQVEYARTQENAAEHKILHAFTKADRVHTSIRPDLIAGARIIVDEERELDVSLSGKVRQLFQS